MTSPPDRRSKKHLKLYVDEVKLRHTSHWDADYMSREEFDAYMRGEKIPEAKQECDKYAAHPWENEQRKEDEQERALSAWQRFLQAIFPKR